MSEIDTNMLENVGASINYINYALNNLNVSDDTLTSINNLIDVLENLGSINADTTNKLNDFINSLSFQSIDKNSAKNILNIISVLNTFSTLDLDKLNDNLENLDSKNIDNLTKFIDSLIKKIKKIDIS